MTPPAVITYEHLILTHAGSRGCGWEVYRHERTGRLWLLSPSILARLSLSHDTLSQVAS